MAADRSRVDGLMAVGRWQDAASQARDLLKEHPDDPDLLVRLGAASINADDERGALEAAERAVAVAPSWAGAHLVLGDVHLMLTGRHASAVDAYSEAIRLDPMSVGAFTGRSQATTHLVPTGKSRTKKSRSLRSATIHRARRDAEMAIRLAPESPLGHIALAKVHMADGKMFAARESARSALALEPESGVALQVFGMAAHGAGDTRGASAALVAAGKADPRSATPMKLLRRVGNAGVVSIVGAWIAVRLFLTGARAGGAALVVGVVGATIVAAIVIVRWLGRRQAHRSRLAPEATRALAIDRAQRRSRLLRRGR